MANEKRIGQIKPKLKYSRENHKTPKLYHVAKDTNSKHIKTSIIAGNPKKTSWKIPLMM